MESQNLTFQDTWLNMDEICKILEIGDLIATKEEFL